jgi:hypothetical protein
MSLDITLTDENGVKVFSANITHNLGAMAELAGIYTYVWRPEEAGITQASNMIHPLEQGMKFMCENYSKCIELEPENKWGQYKNFLPWLAKYYEACKKYPTATINADR